MIILVLFLLISFLQMRQPILAVSLPTTSSPLILVTPVQTRQQRQLYAIQKFFPKIEEIHTRLESRASKLKDEGQKTSKIDSDLAKNNIQISVIKQAVADLDTQINFANPTGISTKSIDTKLRSVISNLKSIYLLQKQIIVTMKKLTPVVKKIIPTEASTSASNL